MLICVGMSWRSDDESLSVRRGTIGGLHFQTPPKSQAKLVRVLRGSIYDVAVDLRVGSPTYGRRAADTLTADGASNFSSLAGSPMVSARSNRIRWSLFVAVIAGYDEEPNEFSGEIAPILRTDLPYGITPLRAKVASKLSS